jgi:hypothetical protein
MTPEQKARRIKAARKAARFRWVPDSARKLREWMQMFRGLDPHSGIVNMGEVRISDKLLNDPRMLRLASRPNARLLFWESLQWADREASEGLIDDVVLPSLCRGFERERQAAVDALVSVGFWERRNSGYYFIDWPRWGKATRAARLAREQQIRDARAEAGRKGAEERERRRREAEDQANLQSNGEQNLSKPNSEQANDKQPIYTDPPAEWDGNVAAPLPDEDEETMPPW